MDENLTLQVIAQMNPFKILITTPTYPPFNSGLGNAVQQQAIALINNGFTVVVATGGRQRGQRRDEASGAVIEMFNVQGADFLLNPIRGQIGEYERFLADSNFDVVLMNAWQTWSTDLCLQNLDKIKGRKYLYSHCLSTNSFFWCQPLRSLIRYLFWRPYWWRLPKRMAQLDGLVFLAADGSDSRFDDLRLAKRLGVSYSIVPNALSSSAMTILDQPIVGRECRQQLIAIGSYDWLKGHDFVLRVYAKSSAKNKVHLKIFGQNYSSFTNKLRQQAIRLGIEDGFVSFHEQIRGTTLLAECSRSIVLLSGSQTECQPLVLLDAMAAGTPFVARLTGCIASMSGGLGVKTADEAAKAIDCLLFDNSKWFSLSGAGRKQVAEMNGLAGVAKGLIVALTEPYKSSV